MFHTLFYNPIYNLLVFIIDNIPGGDVGIATILATCVVKIVLFPVSKKAAKTQMVMKSLEPELNKIKEQYGSNREEFARKTMDFYKKNEINPFASFSLLLIQFPIIIALAFIFYRGGLPVINTSILYSFIPVPEVVNTMFLGLLDISKRSVVLSILAGLAQFVQIRLSVPAYKKPESSSNKPSFQDDLARSMNMQMRYVMPAFMFFVSLSVSGAVALYWITGSLFMIGQELYLRRHLKTQK